MRSLFHFPFPCTQPPSQQPSPTATVPLQPEMSHRPHPAPVRHRRRSPALLSAVRPPQGPWLARIAPYASPFSRMREKGPLPGNIRPKCMLFEIRMATSSPHASISGRNRAIRDTWRANLAAKGPFSRRGARNHAWREDVASAARPFRGSGLRSGRTGFAPCGSGMAERALRPAARAWPACRMRAPCHLACARRGLRPLPSRPRSSPPSCTRHASPPASRPPRGPRTDASRYLRAAPIPPAARTHRVQETSGTTQATQCEHKNRIPKWGPY